MGREIHQSTSKACAHHPACVHGQQGVGLCGVDELLVTEGGDTLTPREAISFLQLQENFTFEYCDTYSSNAYIALTVWGMVLRLFAYLALRFAKRSQY